MMTFSRIHSTDKELIIITTLTISGSVYGRQYDNVGMLHDTNSVRGSMNAQEQMYYPERNCE